MKRLLSHLSYANVVSTLCLFLLLGGGAALAAGGLTKNSVGTNQLRNNSITTAKIRNRAVTGAKVKLSSLGTVPSANHAAIANRLPAPEAIHVLGAAGEPALENGFVPISVGGVGFYKDHDCVVHLIGTIEGKGGSIAFTLPARFRPEREFIQVILAGSTLGWLEVFSNDLPLDAGAVIPISAVPGTHVFALSGISFRAAGC